MKYEAIRTYSSEFSVAKMCKVLELTKGAYYNWLRRKELREEKKREEVKLVSAVRKIFDDNRKTYGYRKMFRVLKKEGIEISEYRTRKIMKENGLYPVYIRKFRPPKKRNFNGRFYQNEVDQQFDQDAPNKVWAGDITYIKTTLG